LAGRGQASAGACKSAQTLPTNAAKNSPTHPVTLTNHCNPLQVHSNTADPQYGRFFGNYTRKYLLDFDFPF